MSFGFGSAVDLEMVVTAKDMATDVLESISQTLESVITKTADFQSQLTMVQTNTTMTTSDIAKMREVILAMNRESGAPLDQLATAFMKIDDITGNLQTSIIEAQVAQKGATGTYSDQVTTAQILANAMHEYGLDTSTASTATQRHAEIVANATQTMGTLIIGARASGVQMQQFAEAMRVASAWGANLGVPLADITAAMATLTKHGFDAADAATQLRNEFTHIANPAAAAQKEITQLSAASGVNLVADFSAAGLSSKGLSGIMADLGEAYRKVGLSGAGATEETFRLIPAQRGSAAAFILTGTGLADYNTILGETTDKTRTANIVQKDYEAVLGTFNQKVAILGANWNQFLLDIGQPILDSLTPYLNDLIDWMNSHTDDIKTFGAAIGEHVGGAIKGLIADIPILVTQLGVAVSNIETFATSVGNFFDAAGTHIHEALFQLTAGLYDVIQGVSLGIDNTIRHLLDLLNPIVEFAGHPDLKGPAAADANALAVSRATFLAGLFPDLNPATGTPYRGGGDTSGTGGGGGAYSSDMPGVDLTNPAAVRAWIAAHPSDGGGSSRGRGGPGGGGSDYLDAQQALAAAQLALSDAGHRFNIDFAIDRQMLADVAVQKTLHGDIAGIVQAMGAPILNNSHLAILDKQTQLLLQIEGNTKSTYQSISGNYRVFAPFQTAGEGQTIAAYGLSASSTTAARTIAALERLVAQQDAKLRQDEQTIQLMQAQLSQEGATARNTSDMARSMATIAREAGRPTQPADPRIRSGLVTAGRQ